MTVDAVNLKLGIHQDRPTEKQSMNRLCVGVQCSLVPTVREWAGLIYIQAYATGSAQTDHLVGNVEIQALWLVCR